METHQKPGFFPNLLAVLLFVIIMIGMFFGFTRFYPSLVERYRSPQPSPLEDEIADEAEPSDGVEQIAPFVRGILSGIETAQLTSEREQGILNINAIGGYQQGVRTALLTSRNWYNLDRQLFQTAGISLGVQNAIVTSKTTQQRATLEYQIKLIQRIQLALSTNLEELLDANLDRRQRALEDYLNGLKKLSSEAAIEVGNMQRIIDEAKQELEQNLSTSEQFGDSFTEETSEFITENIDRNLQILLTARKRAEEARVTIGSTQQILAKLGPLSQRLPQVISAIEANFEALAAGIKVAPSKGVDLPILKE